MNNKRPVRLAKIEPITLTYNKEEVYILGFLFILMLMLLAFNVVGSESYSNLLGRCI